MRLPVFAAPSSPIPAVLAKLGPLGPDDVADLRPFLQTVPDPRSRRGRWYSLTSVLLVCAAAAVSGARSIDELAEWGARADSGVLHALGVRRHLLRWRQAPSRSAIGRDLERLDGDALDTAVGAWLTRRHGEAGQAAGLPAGRTGRRAIAVDGKALRGSARLEQPRRHLLSALTHGCPVTLAQTEIGRKTNETTHFRPLLAPLDLSGDVITFNALHSVQANVAWLVNTKQAHYVAVIKTNQPTAWAQLDRLDWTAVPVQHTSSNVGHGRRESRSIKASPSTTISAASPSRTRDSPCASTAAASRPDAKRHAKPSTRSPASTLTRPLRPNWPPTCADAGPSKTPATTSETSPSPRTPPPFTPAPHPARWPPSATSRSAPSRPQEQPTSPRPPAASGTTPNEPSHSWVSPTTRTLPELDHALAIRTSPRIWCG
ncbi:ISAs1 family transposase [Streptomyces sp. NPDC006235]|uniref:ISAs1 family transposase n=1 Tax=Streptomyces sp. NPDC006235 TaxID=3156736 RepID=UPI0033B59119